MRVKDHAELYAENVLRYKPRMSFDPAVMKSMALVSSAEENPREGLWFRGLFSAFSAIAGTGIHVYAGFMRRSTLEPLSQPLRIASFEPTVEMAALETAKRHLQALFTNGESIFPALDAMGIMAQGLWERALAEPDSAKRSWWETAMAPHGQWVLRPSLSAVAVTGYRSARDVDGFHLPLFQLTLKR